MSEKKAKEERRANEPGKREYIFYREVAPGKMQEYTVKEEDLTMEQMKELAVSVVQSWVDIPDPAQDLVLTFFKSKIDQAQTLFNAAAEARRIQDGPQGGERRTEGGIILPG